MRVRIYAVTWTTFLHLFIFFLIQKTKIKIGMQAELLDGAVAPKVYIKNQKSAVLLIIPILPSSPLYICAPFQTSIGRST